MALNISILPGPLTSEMTREQATAALVNHPGFDKKGNAAPPQLEQIEGRWVAAIVKQAGPFDGALADASEEAPGPKSEGPDDTAPDGPPSPDDGPPAPDDSDGGDDSKGDPKGGMEQQISQILDALTQLGQALGVPIGGGDSMVPGPDDGMGGPPGPPGAGGPPPEKIMHEKALKPGEVPPGGTPLGAPAFASTQPQIDPRHPWAHMAGKVANWEVEDRIGDRPLADVEAEVRHLASEIGYGIAHFTEDRDAEGHRTARAVISAHAR